MRTCSSGASLSQTPGTASASATAPRRRPPCCGSCSRQTQGETWHMVAPQAVSGASRYCCLVEGQAVLEPMQAALRHETGLPKPHPPFSPLSLGFWHCGSRGGYGHCGVQGASGGWRGRQDHDAKGSSGLEHIAVLFARGFRAKLHMIIVRQMPATKDEGAGAHRAVGPRAVGTDLRGGAAGAIGGKGVDEAVRQLRLLLVVADGDLRPPIEFLIMPQRGWKFLIIPWSNKLVPSRHAQQRRFTVLNGASSGCTTSHSGTRCGGCC